jgi:periplasmic protein TonB
MGQLEFPAMPAAEPPQDQTTDRFTTTEVVRLLIAPVVVTLLFAGGVYWLRLQPPASSGSHEQASTIQVHLIPHQDVVPILTASPSRTPDGIAERTEPSRDVPQEAPVAVAPVPSVVPSRVPSSSPAQSIAKAAPSKAAIQFQQALLRHIGRYQRYPSAARRNHLQGTVQTYFSLGRDGTLLGVWVKTSSGQPVLDTEAIETIRRAQPLPPIPPDLPDHLGIQLSLAFDPF